MRSLGQIGPVAKEAIPDVKALFTDPETVVAEAARTAARQIDPTLAEKK